MVIFLFQWVCCSFSLKERETKMVGSISVLDDVFKDILLHLAVPHFFFALRLDPTFFVLVS